MTLQNFNKILDKYDSQFGVTIATDLLHLLNRLPFYDWHNSQNIKTFNYMIGLPQKNWQSMPLFDYEQMLFDALQSNKHIWIKGYRSTRH